MVVGSGKKNAKVLQHCCQRKETGAFDSCESVESTFLPVSQLTTLHEHLLILDVEYPGKEIHDWRLRTSKTETIFRATDLDQAALGQQRGVRPSTAEDTDIIMIDFDCRLKNGDSRTKGHTVPWEYADGAISSIVEGGRRVVVGVGLEIGREERASEPVS